MALARLGAGCLAPDSSGAHLRVERNPNAFPGLTTAQTNF